MHQQDIHHYALYLNIKIGHKNAFDDLAKGRPSILNSKHKYVHCNVSITWF